MQPRIVITGSTGFIGQELLRSQLFKDCEIRVCDQVDSLLKLGSWAEGAVLLHLAGQFSGGHDALWASNVELTKQALDYFGRSGGERVIFLSTGAVYGGAVSPSGSREDDPIQPANYYGFTKWIAEKVVEYEWGRDGRPYHILRLPNVYGQRQQKGVVFLMQRQILERGEVVIDGDGEQRRDFLHVSDLLDAIEKVILRPEEVGVFNVSSHLALSINALAEMLVDGRNIIWKYGPENNRLRELVLDISKAQKRLGYEPKVNAIRLID
jgi:nucleoside-diphosphate-sugar epimerase